MGEELRPEEAARALVEIEQRHEQVIRLATIPTWFWWAIAGLIVGLSAAIESRRPLVLGIGIAVFVVGILATVGRIVAGSVLHAQPRNDLVRPAGVIAILGFVALVLAVTLPTGFALKAAGTRYPATLSALICGVLIVLGGPLLMRYLHRVMRANVTGGRR
ncbi:MAG TPA: hypothetical protein VFC00_36890 [Micromonosporaceae bacterium]|nr:hypothetical protein [Micromonosporaceae bacterium]